MIPAFADHTTGALGMADDSADLAAKTPCRHSSAHWTRGALHLADNTSGESPLAATGAAPPATF